MSWSISVTGTRDAVKAEVVKQLDAIKSRYAGKPEADDVDAVQSRALRLLDALVLSGGQNACKVEASGSHYAIGATGIGAASFKLDVALVSLAL